jgi:hypothetical protein
MQSLRWKGAGSGARCEVQLMKTIAKLAALSLITVFAASGMEARAQFQSVDPTKLPNASKPYTAPKRIQIVPENPIVTSRPNAPEAQKLFVFDTALPAAPAPQIIRMSAGGAGGGLPPGVVDLNALPQSRFGSNIPSSGPLSMQNSLPKGMSSNGLLNQGQHVTGGMAPPSSLTRPTPMSSPGLIRKVADQQAAVYERPLGSGAAGSSSSKTETQVSGQIRRTSLLKP